MLVHAITSDLTYEFASDVHAGLTRPGQKELPSKYLYDDVGSALFEVISRLPEYGLTRADERLLQRHASEIVDRLDTDRLDLDRLAMPVAVAELGSGTGKKTRWLLEALLLIRRLLFEIPNPCEASAEGNRGTNARSTAATMASTAPTHSMLESMVRSSARTENRDA